LKASATQSDDPRWLGYRLIDGYPQFHYTMSGADVKELVRPAPSGLRLQFEILGVPADEVIYDTDPEAGASFTSDCGKWQRSTLTLSAAEARKFTITLTERPKVEPLAYWSMNDVLWSSPRIDPAPGVVGRAFTPGGFGRKPQALDSGIAPSQLDGGATFMAWVNEKADSPTSAVFALGKSWMIAAPAADGKWHHVAVVFRGARAQGETWVDGEDRGATAQQLGVGDNTFTVGSVGETYLTGLIDEVRIFDRALPAEEIKRIYAREARIGGIAP